MYKKLLEVSSFKYFVSFRKMHFSNNSNTRINLLLAEPKKIADFLTITFKKSGAPSFTYDYKQEERMWQYLENLGFGYIVLDKKKVIYRIEEATIKSVSAAIVRDAFWDFLEFSEFEDLPENVTNHDLLNWYLDVLPLKTSKFPRFLKRRVLTEDQIHQLRMEGFEYS